MGTFVDLFAGCGGFSLGFKRAGWKLRFAVEHHQDAFNTYKRNLIDRGASPDWPKWLPIERHDIVELLDEHGEQLSELSGHVDLVIGGPPCQGFSLNGKRQQDDPRNELVMSYLEAISRLMPKMLVLENVLGFTSMARPEGQTYAQFVKTRLEDLGYQAWSRMIVAADWGVPQKRPRFFLIGIRNDLAVEQDPFDILDRIRPSFLKLKGLRSDHPVSVSEALDDLRVASNGLKPDADMGHLGFKCINYQEPANLSAYAKWIRKDATEIPTNLRLARHTNPVVKRFKKILAESPRGQCLSKEERSFFGLKKYATTPLCPDSPSATITTLPDDLIHYSEPRTLTVREHARLQSFPDWFEFTGPYTSGGKQRKNSCPRYTQVGNAVPPLLAEAIGKMLNDLLITLTCRAASPKPETTTKRKSIRAAESV